MRNINTEGIILHKKAYGEGHELVFLFSKELGKIKTQAKGSRKIKSKFLGHLETLNICKLELYNGPHSMLITECEAVTPFRYEQLSKDHTNYALKIAKIFDQTVLEGEVDKKLYNLIKNAIIDLKESENAFLSFLKTTTALIKELGYFHDFANSCPHCHEKLLSDESSLLTERREIRCKKCIKITESSKPLDAKYRKLMSYLEKINDREHRNLKISPQDKQALTELTEGYLMPVG